MNIKQILAGGLAAVMAGATMGIGAFGAADLTSYPDPFVSADGTPNFLLVAGEAASPADVIGSVDIAASLSGTSASVTSGGGTTTSGGSTISGGDKVKVETSSDKLNLGDPITTVRATSITKTDLANTLKDGTYVNREGTSYTFTQSVALRTGIMNFTHFKDSDYDGGQPSLGFKIQNNQPVLNYTVSMNTAAVSDVSTSGRLEDFEGTTITLLGKTWTILNAYNGTTTNLKFDLMGGASSETVGLNEKKQIVLAGSTSASSAVDDKTFDVELVFIDASNTKFVINGETTTTLAKGATYTLKDGTTLGVKDISYQAFKGGVQTAEIMLGAQKLTISDTGTSQLNGVNINGLTTAIVVTPQTGPKNQLNSITFAWTTDKKVFVTESSSLALPGLGGLKFVMAPFTTPSKEELKITNSGSNTIQVTFESAAGPATFGLLSGGGNNFNNIGTDGTNGGAVRLVTAVNPSVNLVQNPSTSALATINFDSDTDKYFIATYKTTTAAESYLMRARATQENSVNYTAFDVITDAATTEVGKVQSGTTITKGSVVLTPYNISYAGNSQEISAGANVTYLELYTKSGLMMSLPYNSTAGNITTGTMSGLNLSTVAVYPSTYTIRFAEETNTGTLTGGGQYNVTVGWTSSGNQTQVTGITGAFLTDNAAVGNSNYWADKTNSQKYYAYVLSALGSKITYDQSQGQDTATIEYHGSESYGNLWAGASDVTVSSAGAISAVSASSAVPSALKQKTGKLDTQLSKADVENKNLVVIGGPAVNKLAADLLGKTFPAYGEASGIPKDQALIQLFEAPTFASVESAKGKTALLVAGWEAAHTQVAATVLQQYDTTANKAKLKGTKVVLDATGAVVAAASPAASPAAS